MLQREIVRFRASDTQPNPLEVDYWIDITSNYYGGCIRYYRNDTNTWEMLGLNDKQVDAIIDYINNALDQIEQFINDSITEIRNELAEFKDELKEEVNKLWQYINQKVNELKTYVDGKVTDLTELINQEITNRINADNNLQSQINELKHKINNLDSKITTVNNRITNLESSIDDIEQSITSINNKITNIENNLGNVGELLDEEYITQLINKLISENKISVLDPVQQAMNKGTGVVLALPSANNGKISLPIWTGTEAEYNQLTKVAGMTYNIIDEESE